MFRSVIFNKIRRRPDKYSGTKYEVGNPSDLGIMLEHITVLTEVQVISIYLHLGDSWFSVI